MSEKVIKEIVETKVVTIGKGDVILLGVDADLDLRPEDFDVIAGFFAKIGVKVLLVQSKVTVVRLTEKKYQQLEQDRFRSLLDEIDGGNIAVIDNMKE
jgi:hypothetical protein